MFSVKAEVGIYPLPWDLSGSEDPQTVALYAADGSMNNIATEGAIEIISVDTVADVVKGRIDARHNSETFINGDFEISYCK